MSANERQVGGAHYQRGNAVQHWDFVEAHGIGYLEAAASKYLLRWPDKNGVQDVAKSFHYTEKLRELHIEGSRYQRGTCTPSEAWAWVKTQEGVGEAEQAAIVMLFTWKNVTDLTQALRLIDGIHDAARVAS